jgi:hypothetical protein
MGEHKIPGHFVWRCNVLVDAVNTWALRWVDVSWTFRGCLKVTRTLKLGYFVKAPYIHSIADLFHHLSIQKRIRVRYPILHLYWSSFVLFLLVFAQLNPYCIFPSRHFQQITVFWIVPSFSHYHYCSLMKKFLQFPGRDSDLAKIFR